MKHSILETRQPGARSLTFDSAVNARSQGIARSRFARLTLAALLTVPLLASCNKTTNPTPNPPAPPAGTAVYYTAIGASDTAGIGASVVCVPFTDCPNGTGYVPLIAKQLGASGAKVTLMNLGIPTAVIGPDFEAIGAQFDRTIFGNFIDREAPFVPANSTVVTIFAGGNDTNTIAAAVGGGAAGGDTIGYVNTQIRAFGADYDQLLQIIRGRAASVRIVVANLPNFAGMPFTASYSRDRKQLVQKISVGFSTQVINPLAARGIPVVDILCDPQFMQASIYSSDGFHPNDTGYSALAAKFLAAINSNSYPAPQASCSQMALVPPL